MLLQHGLIRALQTVVVVIIINISVPVQRPLPLSNRSPEVRFRVHDDAQDGSAAGHVQIAVLLFAATPPAVSAGRP